MDAVEAWDTEMDALVKWLEQYPFPETPFDIGYALKVVDFDVFMRDIRLNIDRCEFQKEYIAPLRYRLKAIKEWMEQNENKSED